MNFGLPTNERSLEGWYIWNEKVVFLGLFRYECAKLIVIVFSHYLEKFTFVNLRD